MYETGGTRIMQQRTLGATGRQVSEVGLGTWQLGGEWGQVDDATAEAVLAAAVASGVTFFDTADVYGPTISETRIGNFLKSVDKDIFVATKLGRFPDPGWPDNFALDVMRQHAQASANRLGVETLDLIQTHCLPHEVMQRGEIFENLRTLKQEGLIRDFGASVETMDEALTCVEQEGLASLQIIFNIFRQKPIETLFAKAQSKNIALIVRLPMASGLLSGKFNKQSTFAQDDHRNFNRDGASFNVGETFAGLTLERGVELIEELRDILPGDITLAQAAMRWILDHEAVSVVIPGAKRPQQVTENCSASELSPLPADVHLALRAWYGDRVASEIRGPY
jgi:aryl-alcohol dehydrogenase-like predicted oxidoreductase